jgi:hypothetical protein
MSLVVRGVRVLLCAGLAAGLGSGGLSPAAASPRTLLSTSVWGDNYVSVSDGTTMREIKQSGAQADGPAVLEATPDESKIYLENGGPDARIVGGGFGWTMMSDDV